MGAYKHPTAHFSFKKLCKRLEKRSSEILGDELQKLWEEFGKLWEEFGKLWVESEHLGKRLKKVVRYLLRGMDFFLSINRKISGIGASKYLVGPGHPRTSARH